MRHTTRTATSTMFGRHCRFFAVVSAVMALGLGFVHSVPIPPIPIPDNAYNGNLDSMGKESRQFNIPFPCFIRELTANVRIDHTYIGDLTVKLEAPDGRVVTLLARPGSDAQSPRGHASGVLSGAVIEFVDSATGNPEDLGAGGDVDANTSVYSFGLTADGVNSLTDLKGMELSGQWTMYVGDSALGDTGEFNFAGLAFFCLEAPSAAPSGQPSFSAAPSTHPSAAPSFSAAPSGQPSLSAAPSGQPSFYPSAASSGEPSFYPSAAPSTHPSAAKKDKSGKKKDKKGSKIKKSNKKENKKRTKKVKKKKN